MKWDASYRNEGMSPKHNPEFTMIELYWAYANYETMMDLTQQIICDAIQAQARATISSGAISTSILRRRSNAAPTLVCLKSTPA